MSQLKFLFSIFHFINCRVAKRLKIYVFLFDQLFIDALLEPVYFRL